MIPNFFAKVSDNIYWELKAWKKRPESWERRGSKEFQTNCEKNSTFNFDLLNMVGAGDRIQVDTYIWLQ